MRSPILLLTLFVLACNTRPARVDVPRNRVPGRLDFEAFTLKAPPDWTKFVERGVDSYVGGLTNGKDTMRFDYGEYGHRIDDFGNPGRLFAGDTIDGFSTVVSIPRSEKQGLVEMDVDLKDHKTLYLAGDVQDIPTALSIFESIHFSNGDPAKTGRFGLDRFVSSSPPTAGALFRTYCGICHDPGRAHLTRPLNMYYVREKGEKWIIDFMMHPDKKLGAPGHESCPERTKLTLEQIKQIINYLKS